MAPYQDGPSLPYILNNPDRDDFTHILYIAALGLVFTANKQGHAITPSSSERYNRFCSRSFFWNGLSTSIVHEWSRLRRFSLWRIQGVLQQNEQESCWFSLAVWEWPSGLVSAEIILRWRLSKLLWVFLFLLNYRERREDVRITNKSKWLHEVREWLGSTPFKMACYEKLLRD